MSRADGGGSGGNFRNAERDCDRGAHLPTEEEIWGPGGLAEQERAKRGPGHTLQPRKPDPVEVPVWSTSGVRVLRQGKWGT